MNINPPRFNGLVAAMIFFATSFRLIAQPGTPVSAFTTPSSAIAPAAILDAMQRVADWQLANPATNLATGWIQAASDAGMMALVGISGDAKYRDAMLALGGSNQWRLGPRKYHADDQCVGQTYAELYLLYREPRMIAPMQDRFDEILARPSTVTNLDFRPGRSPGRRTMVVV